MRFSDYRVAAAIAVRDMASARAFYQDVLGLVPATDAEPADNVAYVCAGDTRVYVFVSPNAGSSRATVAGWGVDDIEAVVDDLAARGVHCLHYDDPPLVTDPKGIVDFGAGNRVAYFPDPDGNILSISQAGAR